MMASLCMNLAAAAVGYMWGYAATSPSETFRQTSLAWYKRKRTVWVQVAPQVGEWTITDVLPENPHYYSYHPVVIDLSWFGVLPDSAWRVRSTQYGEVAKMWRYLCDNLRGSLAAALDAHPASTVTELTELLATRDLNPWTEEVPTEDGWYLVAAQRPDIEPGAVHLSLYEVRAGSRQSWWSKARVAFRRVTLDSRVWTTPSWSERRHQLRLAELRAQRDVAQAEFQAMMAEEEARRERLMGEEEVMRARFEQARKRRDETFQAWEDELLKDSE